MPAQNASLASLVDGSKRKTDFILLPSAAFTHCQSERGLEQGDVSLGPKYPVSSIQYRRSQNAT
jgi:hypothetical protein